MAAVTPMVASAIAIGSGAGRRPRGGDVQPEPGQPVLERLEGAQRPVEQVARHQSATPSCSEASRPAPESNPRETARTAWSGRARRTSAFRIRRRDLVDALADAWGVLPRAPGKVV